MTDLRKLVEKLRVQCAPDLPSLSFESFRDVGAVDPVLELRCENNGRIVWQEIPFHMRDALLTEPGSVARLEWIECLIINGILALRKRVLETA